MARNIRKHGAGPGRAVTQEREVPGCSVCDIVPSTVAHFKWRLGVRIGTKILEYLSFLECLFRVCIGFLRIKIFSPVFLECWKI